MDNYEIRLEKKGAHGATIFLSAQASDFAAIRRAQILGEDCQAVEVWRGMTCIYRQAEPASGQPRAHTL